MNSAKIFLLNTFIMILVTNSSLFFNEIYIIDFSIFGQKNFFEKLNKTGNALLLRIAAVINRVLIFRALKSRQVKIFSYSVWKSRQRTTNHTTFATWPHKKPKQRLLVRD